MVFSELKGKPISSQTVNGIELIEVGGNSAGNFALTTGTVEAGAYVYN